MPSAPTPAADGTADPTSDPTVDPSFDFNDGSLRPISMNVFQPIGFDSGPFSAGECGRYFAISLRQLLRRGRGQMDRLLEPLRELLAHVRGDVVIGDPVLLQQLHDRVLRLLLGRAFLRQPLLE